MRTVAYCATRVMLTFVITAAGVVDAGDVAAEEWALSVCVLPELFWEGAACWVSCASIAGMTNNHDRTPAKRSLALRQRAEDRCCTVRPNKNTYGETFLRLGFIVFSFPPKRAQTASPQLLCRVVQPGRESIEASCPRRN